MRKPKFEMLREHFGIFSHRAMQQGGIVEYTVLTNFVTASPPSLLLVEARVNRVVSFDCLVIA